MKVYRNISKQTIHVGITPKGSTRSQQLHVGPGGRIRLSDHDHAESADRMVQVGVLEFMTEESLPDQAEALTAYIIKRLAEEGYITKGKSETEVPTSAVPAIAKIMKDELEKHTHVEDVITLPDPTAEITIELEAQTEDVLDDIVDTTTVEPEPQPFPVARAANDNSFNNKRRKAKEMK
jgi:hypothetical protein